MSITLDVSNFLQNELSATAVSGDANCTMAQQQATRKMEALLHKELESITDLPKDDTTSIFDEIENFLKLNKYNDKNGKLELHESAKINPPMPIPPTLPPVAVNFPTHELSQYQTLSHCVPTHFLLPEEGAHDYQELDPQLFSVEDGQLQPITSPFMVPGIYKKISNAFGESVSKSAVGKQNVFISANETRGCIVSAKRFDDLYISADENGEPPPDYVAATQRPALLLEAIEEDYDEEVEKDEQLMPPLASNCGTRVPKQWDTLSNLAYKILKLSNRDHIVIDRQRNEIVRIDNATSHKTIYRFLSPEYFGLEPQPNQMVSLFGPPTKSPVRLRGKLGRPRKRPCDEQNITKEQIKPFKQQKRELLPAVVEKPAAPTIEPANPAQRTRSGRIVRTRLPQAITGPPQENATKTSVPPLEDSVDFVQNFLEYLNDSDFRCGKSSPTAQSSRRSSSPVILEQQQQTINSTERMSTSATKRKVPPDAICPTCNKIFLGRRMQRHFVKHPEHMKTPAAKPTTPPPPPPPPSSSPPNLCQQQGSPPNTDMSLFRFLVSKLQRAHLSEDQRADLFLSEINDLVAQLQLRSSRLIRNTSGLHFVSARCSRVLGLPEGHYALDIAAIENEAPPPLPVEPAELAAPCMLNFEHLSSSALPAPPLTNTRTLDYTTLSMDDTLTDEAAQKLNLSAGGKLLPPSEESLLRTVGDLVHDGLQKLQQQSSAEANLFHAPVPVTKSTLGPPGIHYEHASDNAVEAVNMKETPAVQQVPPILGLSVDFFQFNND